MKRLNYVVCTMLLGLLVQGCGNSKDGNTANSLSGSSAVEVFPVQTYSDKLGYKPSEGLFLEYVDAENGISAKIENGKVSLIFETEKLPQWAEIRSNETYSVEGIEGQCVGLFVGDIGQDTYPVVCLLKDNGRVQVVDVYSDMMQNRFVASPELEDVADIVSFTIGGGGAYAADDGSECYSYATIYAKSKEGQLSEIVIPETDANASGDNPCVAYVSNVATKAEALQFLKDKKLPSPLVYGDWGEYESTFIVMPNTPDSRIELWNAAIDDEYNTIKDGGAPIAQASVGQPVVFSYQVPEIIPQMMVICVDMEDNESSWVPTFSGEDGSLITDSDFIRFE